MSPFGSIAYVRASQSGESLGMNQTLSSNEELMYGDEK
jgi:hypothetical protein